MTHPQLAGHCHVRVDAVVLRTEPDPVTVEGDTPAVGPQGPGDELEGGALTSSIQTDQTETLARPHVQTRRECSV